MLLASTAYDDDGGSKMHEDMIYVVEIVMAIIFVQLAVLAYWMMRRQRAANDTMAGIAEAIHASGNLNARDYSGRYREVVEAVAGLKRRQDAWRAYLIEQTLDLGERIRHVWDNNAVASWEEMGREDLVKMLNGARTHMLQAAGKMARMWSGSVAEPFVKIKVAGAMKKGRSQAKAVGRGRVEVKVRCSSDVDRAETSQPSFDRIVEELAINAAKYSIVGLQEGKGKVLLSARSVAGMIEVEVHNTGKRFSDDPEKRRELLERGRRGADAGDVAGTGLGLAAVQEWLKMGDGEIELGNSDELGGGRVTVRVVTV